MRRKTQEEKEALIASINSQIGFLISETGKRRNLHLRHRRLHPSTRSHPPPPSAAGQLSAVIIKDSLEIM